MDSAYDHLQEEILPRKEDGIEDGQANQSLNDEFQEAYKAVANSPWGATIGGLWGTVKKAVSITPAIRLGWL